MIVLDSNIISEVLKPAPDDRVLDWLDRQAPDTLFITTITIAENLFGVEALPDGKRKKTLHAAYDAVYASFRGRILPYDEPAARLYSTIAAQARRAGQGFPVSDGYIAATAASRGMYVATRDTGPYLAVRGPKAINPWSDPVR